MLEFFLITVKNKQEKKRNHVFVCMEMITITEQKRIISLFSFACSVIGVRMTSTERIKEKEITAKKNKVIVKE
jgi:hypothetical protein